MTGIIDDIVQNDSRYSFGTEGKDKPEEIEAKAPEKSEGLTPPPEIGKPDPENNPEPGKEPIDKNPENKTEVPKTPNPEDVTKQLLSGINERLNTQYSDFEAFKNDYSQINTLRESETNLKNQLSKVSNPLGDNQELAEIYGFQKETRRSISDYFTLKNLDLQNADSLDIMVANAVLNNPSLKGKDAAVRSYLEKKYKLVGEDLDEEEIANNRIDLDLNDDVNKARQSLAELKSKIKSPDFENFTKEKIDPEKWKNSENQWKNTLPHISGAIKDFKIFESSEDEKNGKDPLTTIEVPEDIRNNYDQKLLEYITQNKLEPTQENQQMVYGLLLQDYIVNNFLTIASAYSAKKLEANNAMWSERTGVDISKLGKDVVPKENLSDVEKFNTEQLDSVLNRIGVRR